MSRKNDQSDQILAQLREFNKLGMAAIVSLTAAAEDLQQRVQALEEFQRKLAVKPERRPDA